MADQEYFWSTVLDAKTTYEWDPEKNFPKEEDGLVPQHKLVIKNAVLSPSAPAGEIAAVELVTKGYAGAAVKTLIAVLVGGTNHQTTLDLSLRDEPAKLVMAKGSGPVYLVGSHQISFPDAGDSSDPNDESSDSESESDEEEEEEEEEEIKPVAETPAKKDNKKEVEKKDSKKEVKKEDKKKDKKDDKKDVKKEEKK